MLPQSNYLIFFFFNDTATTEIYTLSLHDALPISEDRHRDLIAHIPFMPGRENKNQVRQKDRKSTRLNSSHLVISYAVFCLKKKKKHILTSVTSIYVLYSNEK